MKKLFIITLAAVFAFVGCTKNKTDTNIGTPENVDVVKIYNLVILDRSGSMYPLREAAVQGYNETLEVIRKAQEQYGLEQQNLVSLVLFNQEVTNIIELDTIRNIPNLLMDKYQPDGMTAMFDAIGLSLKKLQTQLDELENATAVVTIISDGLENASRLYSLEQLVKQIDKLKEQGVMFVFMGTNQNVEYTASMLHIDEHKTFAYTAEGMREAWQSGAKASADYYDRMQQYNKDMRGKSKQERNNYYRLKNEAAGWFDRDSTPND